MEIELSRDESEAVQKALASYLSDLRMEIADTDNPQYKRELRDERTALERAIGKLDGSAAGSSSEAVGGVATGSDDIDQPTTRRIVRLWWSMTP
jgi:hypothetical protein